MLERLLGSRLRAQVIGWLFTHTDERYYVRQLMELLGEDSTNLSRELARLESLGLLLSTRSGRQKYYHANPDSSMFDELKSLAAKTAGTVDILRRALEEHHEDIQAALVFGSFARHEQTADSNLDVMVIGNVDGVVLRASILRAESGLRRTINYSLLSQKDYQKQLRREDGFLRTVLEGPKLMIMGALDDD